MKQLNMTDVETRRFEEANQAGQRALIRGAAGTSSSHWPLDRQRSMAWPTTRGSPPASAS
jgi:hypothetical protein